MVFGGLVRFTSRFKRDWRKRNKDVKWYLMATVSFLCKYTNWCKFFAAPYQAENSCMDMELQVCSCRSQSASSYLIWASVVIVWWIIGQQQQRPCCRLQLLTPQAKGWMIYFISEMVIGSYCFAFLLFSEAQCCYVISKVYSTPLVLVWQTLHSQHNTSLRLSIILLKHCLFPTAFQCPL